ncbi:ABC transporter ATP-binding protein [Streptomyces chattanoogensis]|uniref:ABC-type quaternary amine transporter n=1 Tax=Streptomyces chattanoogensis TaxID=66876 RepID=A0A0N0XRU8_9ACTN|nr:ABC transporter ATP-binding protein [Streptomyces chattanoogensis]KPC60128.1 spermidine/putrescine ABC transporter ATP-binding protein [Streptomyces chattanoogensis]
MTEAARAAADAARTTAPHAVRLTGVAKDYGPVRAVNDVELTVHQGEFFSLLGPSGSGKTTLLRLIAGFERPTAGRIALAGRDVTALPPSRRDVHTVFQDYALFPHMTVEQNVAYALTVRGVRKAERLARAREGLATVRLDGYGPRRPAQLSGGQRQRVALARALIDSPGLLLLDEPLGALDLGLRHEMQAELKRIQRATGVTFLLVTHDQEEALTLSDRLAVLDGGRIEQTGPPLEVYDRPASAFVAGFVGTTNLLRDEAAVRVVGAPGTYSIRPERIRIAPPGSVPGPGERCLPGRIAEIAHAGAHTRFTVRLEAGDDRLTVLRQHTARLPEAARTGAAVNLVWDTGDAFAVPG